ncbi:MAG: hypothetical protein M0R77_00920 [Gammaproteobacteria bacterium]|nr:hypothetical protein [Acholeplasmataceae bacterium]MCK9529117.1 hypothetical protein [Gammaproteobacteria bacterium]
MDIKEKSLRIIQKSPTTVSTYFNDKELIWDVSVFNNTSHRNNEFDIFEQINQYWLTKPISFQEEVFKYYEKIHSVFQFGGTIEDLTLELGPYMKGIIKLHNPDEIAVWSQISARLYVSSSLMSEYADNGNEGASRFVQVGTRNKTYLKRDYTKLLGLAISIRALVPIFGEFIFQTGASAGVNFKEYRAGKLLEGTTLETCEAYEKLRLYVNDIAGTDKQKSSPILDGISSEEFPVWILYMIIIRRLTVGNLKGDPNQPNSHLVTYIHFYLNQRLLGYENNFSSGKVRDKDVGSANADDESKLSVLETYKTPTEHSPGDYEQMAFYANNIEWCINTLCPGLDMKIYEQAKEASAFMLGPVPFYKAQSVIVQNLIGPYLAPDVLEHIQRIPSLGLYNVVQAMLWQYGYKDLASFITTTTKQEHEGLSGSTHTARMNIPRVMSDMIRDLYPHLKRTSSRSVNSKIEPTPLTTIKNIVEHMSVGNWRSNIHEAWLNELDLSAISPSRRRDWRIPPDIRIQLAKLFIQIGMFEVPFHPDNVKKFQQLSF